MYIHNQYHLTYCTNIHPGESWPEVFDQLKKHVPEVKAKVSPQKPFGLGLRLSNQAGTDLLGENHLDDFKKWLNDQDCYVFTLNGFPYGKFHDLSVKDDVHAPDWLTEERIAYTQNLFQILEDLLPDGMDGGISTSPLSYRFWHDNELDSLNELFQKAAKNIIEVVKQLIASYRSKQKFLHLDIEPEPDGLIENTDELVAFFNNYLIPIGTHELNQYFNISRLEAREAILDHVQVCYDVCHFAVGFEKPKQVFQQLQENGIKVGKIQVSAALMVDLKKREKKSEKIKRQLEAFAESTYLHQVAGVDKKGTMIRYPDLPDALPKLFNDDAEEWRIHYHVPIFVDQYSDLKSTQKDIKKVFKYMKDQPVTRHLEVETYTWDVLPQDLKTDLGSSISRELEWVINNLK